MRYEWQDGHNEHNQHVHVDKSLPLIHSGPGEGVYLNNMTSQDKDFYADLLTIPGVSEVHMSDYSCRIDKGHVFHWSEIEPLVEGALQRHFGEELKPTLRQRIRDKKRNPQKLKGHGQ